MENFSDSTGLDDLKKVSAGLEDLKGKVENENLIENPKEELPFTYFASRRSNFVGWHFLLVKQLEKINPHVAPSEPPLLNNTATLFSSNNRLRKTQFALAT